MICQWSEQVTECEPAVNLTCEFEQLKRAFNIVRFVNGPPLILSSLNGFPNSIVIWPCGSHEIVDYLAEINMP